MSSLPPPLKDWTGTPMSMFRMMGASNHCETHEREANDFYATDPAAVEQICDRVDFAKKVWEPACGAGHISEVMRQRGHLVRSSDLVNRGYGEHGVDFLSQLEPWDGDIITNPPYRYAQEFVEHALSLVADGAKVAMLLKLTFLEGQRRRKLFRTAPPRWVYVATRRVRCALGGNFSATDGGSAMCYAWFVWEKGFVGEPSVRWFNDNETKKENQQ